MNKNIAEILEGNLTKTILKVSLPLVVAFLLQTSFNIIDGIFVGRIGAEALAAVSLAFPMIFLMISLAAGLGVGATSLIARSIGAKDYKKANNAAEHSLLLFFILGLFFTVFGLMFGKHLFKLIGATGTVLQLTIDYTNIIFAGSIFLFLVFIANNILRGEGNMKIPMFVMGGSAILNVILDPIFIFVLGWGVKGAAIATVVSRAVACIAVFVYLLTDRATIKISMRYFKYQYSIIKEIFRIGILSSVSQVLTSISMFILTAIVAKFGTEAIAAYGIAFRLEGIAFMPLIGLTAAVMTIVGQNVGAKNLSRSRRTTFNASVMGIVYSLLVGICFFIFAVPLAKLFNNNHQVVYQASLYLVINAITYMFIAIILVINGSFLGAGMALPPLSMNILRSVIIVIPLAIFLSKMYGLMGVWIAIAIASVITSAISVVWYRLTAFKKK
ncbi:MATE family efflux transporter [Candidatus Woesearchaeota archaeon]|nr:MATE family efflux transporter [Candidatus Woesearchaeota archaeon]